MKTLHDIQQTNQIRQQALQNQQRAALAKALAANSHTMFVMNETEFFELAVNIKLQQGLNEQQILSWLETVSQQSPGLKALWQRRGEGLKSLISYAPSLVDSAALAVLAKDLSRGGNVLTKYQIKNYHGRTYIVIKGYPALRRHLTGSRYLASHPKVVSMGIGKMGAYKAIKSSFILSVVLSVGFHALDQLFNDKKTWHHFFGNIAADLIYATGAFAFSSLIVAVFLGGTAAVTIGPLVVVLVSGLILSTLFYFLDQQIQLGKVIAVLLQEAESKIALQANAAKYQASKINRDWSEDAKSLLHRIFAIPNLRVVE